MKGIKSKSEAWSNWIREIDEILSKTHITTASGSEMEYSDPHFQDQMRRILVLLLNSRFLAD